jgi:hypothetical protein
MEKNKILLNFELINIDILKEIPKEICNLNLETLILSFNKKLKTFYTLIII